MKPDIQPVRETGGLRRAWGILRVGLLPIGALAALSVAAEVLQAQEAPEAAAPEVVALTGQVVHAQTGEPISNVQIVVQGTTRGVLTGPDGRYRVGQLRPGTYRVEAHSIGFRGGAQTVTIGAEREAQADFRLTPSAVPLDEVVVTGQPAAVARREIGNAVVTVNAEALDDAPVFTTSQILQGRAPGVEVLPGGGKAGQGSRIVLRGITSMTQDVHPLVYVDGVRIDNSFSSGLGTGGPTWVGLDDLIPEDIERVEIVRGAAAATLYGTEASAGVIQIFTKRGRGGPQQVSFRSEYGVSQTPSEWYEVSPHGAWFAENFTRAGRQHRQHLSVRGTLDRFSYYASGSVRAEDGVLVGNDASQRSFRANMRVAPRQNFSIGANVGFGQRDIHQPYDGVSPFGLGYHALVGGPRGVPTGDLEEELDVTRIPELEVALQSTRFTAGVSFEFQPFEGFSTRLLLGSDIFNTDNTELHEFGTPFMDAGMKANWRRQSITRNVDFGASYQFQPTPTFRSTTSFGFQAYDRDDTWNWSYGERFVGPGLFTVAVTGLRSSDDSRITTRHAGFYLEEQLGFNDIFFLSLGGRLDGHSAFGADNRFHFYPKANASYVMSEHLTLPEIFGTLRLRAAYGAAGQQPDNFVASRVWRPVPATAVMGLTTGNVGNPDLAPEVSHEVEAGFDVGLLADRLGVEFTFYNQRTEGALIPVQYAPSTGWIEPRWENIGTLRNRGVEATLRAVLLDEAALRWQARASVSTNRNQVESMGGQDPINIVGAQWIQTGHPVGGFFADRQVQTEEGLERVRGDFIGPAFPTRSLQLGTDLGFGGGFNVAMLVEHRGGHYLESNTLRGIATGGDPTVVLANRADFIEPADFWRLREVSLSYALSARATQALPITGATLSLAGRNLLRSQQYTGIETEAHVNPLISLGRQTAFDTPLPRQIVAGVSLQF
ncbi:MAG: TonB-dependent receptor [Gemmatimonadetes bacterium]|nr:TonB-dependent receptor [Gemmatimonadota bacterium]